MKLIWKWILVSGAAITPAFACPPDAPAPEPAPTAEELAAEHAWSAWKQESIELLASHGTADALFATALLQPVVPLPDTNAAIRAKQQKIAARRLALLDHAAYLDPQGGDIAFTAVQVCNGVDACDINDYARRLHRAAPAGGMWLMPALGTAQKAGDTAQVTAILTEMATATRMGSWYGSSVQRIVRAMQNIALPPLPVEVRQQLEGNAALLDSTPEALLSSTATVFMTSVFLPGYSLLDRICRPEHPSFAARRDACHAIGVAMAGGESLIDTRIGLALQLRTARSDDERAAIAARKRQEDWIIYSRSGVPMQQQRDFLQRVAEYGSELRAWTAMVAEAGLPTTPPADWINPRDRHKQRKAAGPP